MPLQPGFTNQIVILSEFSARRGRAQAGIPRRHSGEGRNPPPSLRRRPESSALDKPCPHSGHDHGHDNRTQASGKTRHPRAIPRLDSSLRWNDDGVMSSLMGTPAEFRWQSRVWQKQPGTPVPPGESRNPPPSCRQKPESSGLDKPCPHSGHDHGHDNRTRPSGKARHPRATAASPAWIPACAGMTRGNVVIDGHARGVQMAEPRLAKAARDDRTIPRKPESPAVIPAKAGIQWFRQALPAQRA